MADIVAVRRVHRVLDIYVLDKSRMGPGSGYKLRHLLDRLTLRGQPWTLCDARDIGRRQGARAFLHVDLSNDPPEFSALTQHYDRVINGHASSIDRRLYSAARVLRDQACDGPVIVKSIYNHRGSSELRHAEKHDFYPRLRRSVLKIVYPGYRKKLCPPYRVFKHIDEVPRSVWSNPALIVEKFLADPAAPSITKWRWDFCLDEGITTEAVFSDPLCQPESMLSVGTQPAPPAEIAALRSKMRLDYGSIDFFMTPAGAVPIDVNKTVVVTRSWVDTQAFLQVHLDRAAHALARFARTEQ